MQPKPLGNKRMESAAQHAQNRIMPVDCLATIDFESQRTELKRVLDSQMFRRAPTLARLLAHLCELYFTGRENQIKEYSLGVEVFHRGPSYDPDNDSIVRVEANRLRKRLAEYYAGDGVSHDLQIAIPIGQYVPQFMVPDRAAETDRATADDSLESKEVLKGDQLRRASFVGFRSRNRSGWFAAALAGVILLGILAFRGDLKRLFDPTRRPASAVAAETTSNDLNAQIGPPIGEEIRILAGSSRGRVDRAGKLWSADTFYSGGAAVNSSAQFIARTLNPELYRTSRQGQFRYDIPLKKGVYELRLHFAETVYGPETTGTGGEGNRIMTVRANGRALLEGFDLVADAGASRTANIRVFPDITPAADGLLHLEFTGENGAQAILSAVEILPGLHGRMRPVRILTRQTPYYSNDSKMWSPDSYFEGGQLSTFVDAVTGADDPELYSGERWGNFSYAIPVAPGKYSVILYFVNRTTETKNDAPAQGVRQPSPRVFQVFLNGVTILQNFDLAQEARRSDTIVRRFDGIEPNAQGKLVLSFVPLRGYAAVSGIEVIPQGGR
jgi:hypothetical protein